LSFYWGCNFHRCVVAELFLDGTPIFNFAQLLGYRKGTYDPEPTINRISDPAVQELVKHMIQKDPKKRFAAKKYLAVWSGTAFPAFFGTLHSYISKLMKVEPDEKVTMTKMDLNTLLERFAGKEVPLPSSTGLALSSGLKKEDSSISLSSSMYVCNGYI
jgi:serine/threonine protein kinase